MKWLIVLIGQYINALQVFKQSEAVDDRVEEQPFANAEMTLNQGPVLGRQFKQRSGGFESYKGIPFAKPPVGTLRWKPPVPVENWVEPIQALNVSTVCYQDARLADSAEDYIDFVERGLMGEDCLTLDIYRPIQASYYPTKYPIMVWIHGGGYVNGASGMYEAGRLTERGIIVVMIQYRLGIFGFLNTWRGDKVGATSGNYGLLDQQLAIQFTKDNAAAIGGDPNLITIIGESAGGWSVGMQLLSETADMIVGAVSQSGVAMFEQSNQESPYSNVAIEHLCSQFDDCLSNENPDLIVENLRKVDPTFLSMKDYSSYGSVANWPWWTPVAHDGIFFKDNAMEKLKNGDVRSDINYIIGTNSYEGSLFWLDQYEVTYENISFIFEYLNGYKDEEITLGYRFEYIDPSLWNGILEEYFLLYQPILNVDSLDQLSPDQCMLLAGFINGELGFRKPSMEQARIYKNAGASVYMYYLDIDMPYDLLIGGESPYGVGHANDVSFLFNYPVVERLWYALYSETMPDPWHYETGDIWGTNFVNFVRFEKPMDYWTPFQSDNLNQLTITNNETNAITTMESGMNGPMNYWLNIYNPKQ